MSSSSTTSSSSSSSSSVSHSRYAGNDEKQVPLDSTHRIQSIVKFRFTDDPYKTLAGYSEKAKKIGSANSLVGESDVCTTKMWANPCLKSLPPYPEELSKHLESPCPFTQGKLVKETHIVFPLFPKVSVIVAVAGVSLSAPRTLDSLERLDVLSGGTGYRHIWDTIIEETLEEGEFYGAVMPKFVLSGSRDKIFKDTPAEKVFHWAVMTKDVLPGSRDQSYDVQKELVESKSGYEVPSALDAATAILWANRCSKECFFNNSPWTYTRCQENINGFQLIVGGFALDGLNVGPFHYDDDNIGIAGFKKF